MSKSINIEQNYPYSPEEVWHALTDEGSLKEWLMPSTDLAIKVGQPFIFHMNMPGTDGKVLCKILTVDKPKKLAYSWKFSAETSDTVVTWYLEPAKGGTNLRLEHTGFTTEADYALHTGLTGGWQKKLDELLPKTLASQKIAA